MIVDVARFIYFIAFAGGVGLMIVTNVLAWKLLRPPRKLGFLWWHVTTISVSFLCLGSASLARSIEHLGDATPGWRFYATGIGFGAFLVAQVTIFNVERERYIASRGRDLNEERAA